MTVTLTSVAMTQDIEAVHRWTRVVQAAIAGHRDDLTFARHAAGALELRLTALERQARAMAMARHSKQNASGLARPDERIK